LCGKFYLFFVCFIFIVFDDSNTKYELADDHLIISSLQQLHLYKRNALS